jgi:ABC-2 type transport system permease protein
MRPELIVAEKEFRDHITSKRFLAILAIFMLLALYAMVTGMDSYNKSLDTYKKDKASSDPGKQEMINSMQKQIQDAESRGASAEEIQSLKDMLEHYVNPPMPSVLQVFTSFTLLFAVLGMVLSVSIGFDQITKEKEDGSLKTTLSSPMYRDALINGKAIGAIATIAVAIAATFLMTIAIMLLYGVVPGLEDLLRIVLFFVAALLYCTVFFAIAMATSTIAKSSAMAVIYTIGIVFLILLFSILASLASYAIAGYILGPAPDAPTYPSYISYSYASETVGDTTTYYVNGTAANSSVPQPIPISTPMAEDPYYSYMNKQSQMASQISDTINTVSPINDFSGMFGTGGGIATAILSKQKPSNMYGLYYSNYGKTVSVWESLLYVWTKILGLIVEIVVAFALSYIMFMRMDIR